MKTNFKMLFYMKKQKNYPTDPAPIYLRITVDGKRAELAIPYLLDAVFCVNADGGIIHLISQIW